MENYAGKECNEELIVELSNAGIDVVIHEENRNSEPITNVTGELHGWVFERAWSYWAAKGPGFHGPIANLLSDRWRRVVRAQHTGGYHIDTQAGLNALAACIMPVKRQNEKVTSQPEFGEPTMTPLDYGSGDYN